MSGRMLRASHRPVRISNSIIRNAQGRVKQASTKPKSLGKRPFEGGVCTSVTGKTILEARRQVQQAQQAQADLVEFRLDCIRSFDPKRDLEDLLTSCRLPYIVTYRPDWEGGYYKGKEEDRLAVLKEAASLGAPFIDVELKAAKAFFSGTGKIDGETEIILSHHDYERTPDLKTLTEIVDRMIDDGADITKIATTATDITDCHRLLTLLQTRTRPAIVLGMGEKGLMTRVLAPKFGGFLTFGALSVGLESAPGQPTIQDLRELYRIKDINPSTKLLGIIGNPVAHSKSPRFHNPSLKAIGWDAVYIPLLVDDFQLFIDTFMDSDFTGLTVTVPHKESALRAAEEVDQVTSEIGACNTLVRTETGFKGYNTDWSAATDVIESALKEGGKSLKGATMVVVGAGGASKALAYGGASRGAHVLVANRTREKAQTLVDRLPNGTVISLEDLQKGKIKADVLANGTSLGMEPNEDTTPVPKEALGNFSVVFDAVYTPRETRLLREAKEMGCRQASGLDMFVGQAKIQFKIFTGEEAPEDVVQRLLE